MNRNYWASIFYAEARKLQEASNSMSCAEAAPLVPDAMARMFVACGTPNQIQERIEPLWQRANSMMIVPPSWGLTPERYAAKAAAIAETFWNA